MLDICFSSMQFNFKYLYVIISATRTMYCFYFKLLVINIVLKYVLNK